MAETLTPATVERKPGPSPLLAYGTAFIALAAAILLRYALDAWMGNRLPLVTLFGAVAVAVWVGGVRPAILVALLGYFACNYLFIEPRALFALAGSADVIGFVAYLFTCSLIIGFGEATRKAHRRAIHGREVLQVTLRSIGDAVITTDVAGRITSMNPVAESLTGWTRDDAAGQPLDTVFRIVNERTREPVENPALRALRSGTVVGLANHTVLIRKDGAGECAIDDSAAPIVDDQGAVSGCVLTFRDVSVQRQIERDKARQLMAARLLGSIVESSEDAIISKSLDGVIQTWNAAAERLFGHPADRAIGKHISLVIPPERIGEEDQIVASLKAGQRIEHFETERVRSDGRRLLVSLTISPIKDDDGRVIGASKIVRDVTRQRQAEQRERLLLADAAAANAKFHAFFDQGALFAAITDVNGTVLETNRFSCEDCGYTREQIVGKPFWQGPWWASSPTLSQRVAAAAAQATAGQTVRAEVPYRLADGTERIADFTIQPISDDTGRVLFLAPTGIDVTDRKRAEADREKFVTLIETSTDFIGISDLDGLPMFVNRAGLQMVGLDDIEQARRTPVSSFFFPEDQSRVMDEFFPLVSREGHGELEIRFRHFKTGEALWMAYKVLTLPDAAGRTVAYATVSQDVTGRKQMEDNLRRLALDLSEADRRKNEFLAMLAHELRNPLAPISNAARTLRLAGGDGALQSASEMLERQVGQMARLVDDLLDMSRITRGRIELRRERVDLAPIVDQAVETVRAQYKSMNQEFTVTLPSQPLPLDADPARLAQVIGNLLHNAGKFTDPGGRISLSVEAEDRLAIIRVRDNGIGIAPEHLPRLFDMFTQIDSSLERSRGGLGIGLTLVKTLVEMHGGTVEVRSDGPGRGSEFTVRLPLAAAPTVAVPASISGKPDSIIPRRILVVDDSEDGAESLAMLLELAGHQTHQAHDGVAALDAAARIRPDVVLLDIGLPRMNGYEVCRRIRQEPWGQDVVLVALTGWGQEEDRQQSRDAGFDAHMVKPVNHDRLERFLESLPAPRNASTKP